MKPAAFYILSILAFVAGICLSVAFGAEPFKLSVSRLYIDADCKVTETRLETNATDRWAEKKTVTWHLLADGDTATLSNGSVKAEAYTVDESGYQFRHLSKNLFGEYDEVITITPNGHGFTGETTVIRKRAGKSVFARYRLDAVCQ